MKIVLLLDENGIAGAYCDSNTDEKIDLLLVNYDLKGSGLDDLYQDKEGEDCELIPETVIPDVAVTQGYFDVFVENTPGYSINEQGELEFEDA